MTLRGTRWTRGLAAAGIVVVAGVGAPEARAQCDPTADELEALNRNLQDGYDNAGVTADELSEMSLEEIEALYARGRVPDSLEELDGKPRGLVVAVPPLRHLPFADISRHIGSSKWLPWRGKNFRSHGDDHGEGANRFRVIGELGTFETSIGPSEVDGAPAIRLDYAGQGNPWPISAIRDELRQVGPDLYLGPATFVAFGHRARLLYFAVDYSES